MRASKGFQLGLFLCRSSDGGSVRSWHRRHPCLGGRQNSSKNCLKMTAIPSLVQQKDWGGIYEMDI